MILCWLPCKQYQWCLSTCGACSEVVFVFDSKATFLGLMRVGLFLAPLGMPKWVLTFNKMVQNVFHANIQTTSKHAPKSYWTWKVLYAKQKQPTPDQKWCWVRGITVLTWLSSSRTCSSWFHGKLEPHSKDSNGLHSWMFLSQWSLFGVCSFSSKT